MGPQLCTFLSVMWGRHGGKSSHDSGLGWNHSQAITFKSLPLVTYFCQLLPTS